MITPMDIHNREFKKGFRGYNETEVDEFLDKVVVDYEKVLRENEKLRDQLALNAQEVENYKKLEKNLQDTLSVAQKTADEVLESAKKSAKEMRDNAVRDTQSIYNNTMRETQNIREQAQLESKRLLDDAAHKLRIIVTEYEKIVREKNSFLLKIRTALESELAVTSQLLTSVPHVDELAGLKSSLTKIETENKISPSQVENTKVDRWKDGKVESVKEVEQVPVEVESNNSSLLIPHSSLNRVPEPEEVIEKVSQVVARPKPKTKPVDKKVERWKDGKVESVKEVKQVPVEVESNNSSLLTPNSSLNKVPEPEKTADLEDTKFVEKVEKVAPAEKVVEDDLDKTMTYTPIKK